MVQISNRFIADLKRIADLDIRVNKFDKGTANLFLCRRALLYIVKLPASLKEFYELAQQVCRKIQYLKCRL